MAGKGPWVVSFCVAACLTVWGAGCASTPGVETVGLQKTIWVTRWDWRSADDVRAVVERCADFGCTAVFFQVRGNGTVAYPSRVEVWSESFGFADPGFDPLATAIAAGRARGVAVHAWVNVTPGWRGKDEPRDPRQLHRARPGWFLADRSGQRESLARGGYLGLNPCLPEVRDYLVTLCAEVAATPGLAGLHLDYVRFTSGDFDGIDEFPNDRATRKAFEAARGRDAGDEAFRRFKVDCVTELVRAIVTQARARAPGLTLSAAVLSDPARALASGQAWPEWARAGLVDALVPMAYTDDDAEFDRQLATLRAQAGRCSLVVGVGIYKHADAAQTVRQMQAVQRAGAAGVALFGYGELAKSERAETAEAVRARWQHPLR